MSGETQQQQQQPQGTTPRKVFFILGGPGSGKGTNCARLVEDFGYTHFSAGELLREAARSGTGNLAKIGDIIRSGNIVPSEITVELLRQAIVDHPNSVGYVIDGFPRKEDQARMFEEGIAKPAGILYYDCSEATMEERLLSRGTNSTEKRDDDAAETIRHRFRVNVQECMPVVEAYKANGRCHVIDANRDRDTVYAETKKVFLEMGEKPLKA
ncbi:putative adenylate kinase [Leishmania major strain Friedlin]|uniref:Putative adenylate kinase n=1 Tax=Leishmania major TaxID=5664 RepID=Q9U1D3_LEIMA|nr:putative adenylate kinase [Leishmania major strain Friedlin]CAC22640.1 putative adenylate kinase [Leishmania major strain Friedlin]CAG9567805.1 adenylate_kinase_-_putative [Leishmania major strain Friedlin]|eukprot:XP_888607.1 putative adenylate kinase [Leishmania major strain Friedlin]